MSSLGNSERAIMQCGRADQKKIGHSNGLLVAALFIMAMLAILPRYLGRPKVTGPASAPSPLHITTNAAPGGTERVAYMATLAARGGVPSYTWSVISGQLPLGLTLSSSPTILGTPSVARTFSFQARVEDPVRLALSESYSNSISTTTACGGPVTYCARTDLTAVQLPSPIPNVGNLVGANRVVADPGFNSRIVRVTDANTDPSHRNYTFVASASGSAEENLWNTDSTLFISYNTGAGAYPFAFDPATMRAGRLYASMLPSTGGMSMGSLSQWSRVNSQVLYLMNGTQLQKYDFANRKSPPSPRLIYDYRNSPNCLTNDFPSSPWFTNGGVAVGDSAFAMGFANSGVQDGPGANFVVVFTVGKGCRVYNTATGRVTGDWGPTGTVNIPDRVHIHNAKLSKDGNWVIITWNNCVGSSCSHPQPFFWNVPTLNVSFITSCPNGDCPAHWTEGSTHFFYEDGNHPPNFDLRPFSNMNSFTVVNSSQPPNFTTPWDQHPSWNNNTSRDDTPVCTSSFTPPGAPAKFAFAWQDEVLCLGTDGSGKVWRFAHTFNTDRSHRFSTSEAIGTVSQDGRFFIFSSDWMGTLGSENGSSACKVGSDCRGDVFVVELR